MSTWEIDAQPLQERLRAEKPPLLLDVRQPQEVAAEGVIEGAVLMPMSEIPARVAELPADREIVAYCKRGSRSFNVAAWLRAQGREALSLRGGIDQWKALGLPVRR